MQIDPSLLAVVGLLLLLLTCLVIFAGVILTRQALATVAEVVIRVVEPVLVGSTTRAAPLAQVERNTSRINDLQDAIDDLIVRTSAPPPPPSG